MLEIKRNMLSCVALMAVFSVMVPVSAAAQTEGDDAQISISIPAQSLSGALTQLAEKTGLQLVYDTRITDGQTAPSVSGTMTAREALAVLLAGSGLSYRFTSERSAVIAAGSGGAAGAADPADDGVRAVGVVSVEGVGGPILFGDKTSPVNGVNGSRDVQATEGTGSYTTGAASIVSKVPQTLRETPQSVTVMTAQQLEDQSIVSVRGVLDKITGITVTDGANGEEFNIVSRGFAVTTFTFDGGAPVSFAFNNRPIIELSQYDSVQLVRGSNGAFAGYGDPGGTVNLVRKKPLDRRQFSFEQDAGSWSNFRSELDVTGPLTADGRLRARAVATRVDKEYFFDIAEGHKSSIYGVLEFDVTPTTLFTLGGSHVRENNVPNNGGLPRYLDGEEIDFPRSTCLCVPWSYERPRRSEIFGSIEQQVASNINAKFNATYSRQNVRALYANLTSRVAKGLFADSNLGGNQQYNPVRQLSLDLFVNGDFSVLGRDVQIVLGGNYQNANNDGGEAGFLDTIIGIDTFTFDPYAFPPPPPVEPLYTAFENRQRQYGAYASIKVEVVKNLHVSSAWRYSSFTDSNFAINRAFQTEPERLPDLKDSHLSRPNVGITFDFMENFTLYGSYNHIYQPQILTRFKAPGVATPPPVTGATKEVGLKWQRPDGRVNASLSFYQSKQNNILEPDFNNPGKFTPSYNVKSKGADFEIAGEIVKDLQFLVGYSYNKNERKSAFVQQPNSSHTPHHILKAFATYRGSEGSRLEGLIIGGGVNWQSDYYQNGSLCQDPASADLNAPCTLGFAPYEFTIDPYATFAMRIGYAFSKNIELSLSSENITDVKTYTANPGTSITGYNSYLAPRSLTASLRMRW